MTKWPAIVTTFFAELLLWLLPAAGFIAAYVLYFDGPATAIEPHMRLVASMGLAWLGLRLGVEHLNAGGIVRTAFQLLYSLGLVFFVLYYFVLLVGLNSWGRVPTWRMISVYTHQWRDLVAVLDAPVLLMLLGLSLVFAVAFLIVRKLHSRLRWPQQLTELVRRRVTLVLALGGLVPFAVAAVETYEGIDKFSGEPVMLSLNAGIGIEATQNNQSEGARLLDRREAEVAASYRPGVLSSPRNVILIVGDALRGDHLGVLDYSRPTTPYLDRLVASGQSALIQRILSICSESYCGLMGIARSKFVHEFSRASLTLQQVLAQHGYQIALILGGDHTNFYGLSDALGPADIYWDGSMSTVYVNDDRAVVERVDELSPWDGKPMFLQLHLMSSHGLGKRHEEFVQFVPARNYYRRKPGISDERRSAEAINYYDNGILQFDAIVKDLLESLERRGYLDDAVVIITGDHGEMLGEHGFYAHANKVFEPALDVPLLVLRFGYQGEPLEPRPFASQVDIAPTILKELELPVPLGWSGMALQQPTARKFSFFQQGRDVGLIDLRNSERVWKFWTDVVSEESFAFDASRDPEEMNNLVGKVPTKLRSEWILQLLPASATIGVRALGDPLAVSTDSSTP